MNNILCQSEITPEQSRISENRGDCARKDFTIDTLSPNENENGSLRKRRENFLKNANQIHNGIYDYSKVDYLNNKSKIIIICYLHGEFYQTPHDHLDKCGCPKCAVIRLPQHQPKSKSSFIKDAEKVHEKRYDYSDVNYVSAHRAVVIICNKHGKFLQTPHDHLSGKKCKQCGYDERHLNNGFKWKSFVFPCGRTELVQGYESLTLSHLLKSISPNDIKVHRLEKPVIYYSWNGNTHRYFPDCYLSSSNTIIETKSDYYWNSQYEQNLAKITASLDGGYNVRVVIWNRQHTLSKDLIYDRNNI